jgi:2-polyprenyl-3-methyl-5-hydroxy-6-metoxy-1,4-benzoquinol methylase
LTDKPIPYLDERSIPSQLRKRRFRYVNELIEGRLLATGRCRILDIGGTEYYWNLNAEFMNRNKYVVSIICVNLGDNTDKPIGRYNVTHEVGDATKADVYAEDRFDIIHSNSVIEHVGGWTAVRAMASQIVGCNKPYYVQTPNFWFPIEPHFRFVGWQWMPKCWRASLMLRGQRGFRKQSTSYDNAMKEVESVELLTKRQMLELFPSAVIHAERLGPFSKSFMAIRHK